MNNSRRRGLSVGVGSSRNMKSFFIIPMILFGFAFGIFFMNDTQQFLSEAESAIGEVVDFYENRRANEDTRYAAIVAFSTPDGQTYRFTNNTSSTNPGYNVGDKVEVLYQRDNPEYARIKSFAGLYMGSIIGFLMGFISLGAFVAMKVSERRRRNLEEFT